MIICQELKLSSYSFDLNCTGVRPENFFLSVSYQNHLV